MKKTIKQRVLKLLLIIGFIQLSILGQAQQSNVSDFLGDWKYLRSDLHELELDMVGARASKRSMVITEGERPPFPFDKSVLNILVMPDVMNIKTLDFDFFDAKFIIRQENGAVILDIEDQRPADQRESRIVSYFIKTVPEGISLSSKAFYRNPAGAPVEGTLETIMVYAE